MSSFPTPESVWSNLTQAGGVFSPSLFLLSPLGVCEPTFDTGEKNNCTKERKDGRTGWLVTQRSQQLRLSFSNCIASAEMETEKRSGPRTPRTPRTPRRLPQTQEEPANPAFGRFWLLLAAVVLRFASLVESLHSSRQAPAALHRTVEVAAKVSQRPENRILGLSNLVSSGFC